MKETIIDGVDVAGCEFYQIEANQLYPKAQYCGSMRNTFCENEPNCYYKQLKRLEQENAELKKTLQEIKAICKMDCGDCPYNQDCDCNYSECEEAKIDDILRKIDKVLK